MPQLRHRGPESGGVNAEVAVVTGASGAAAKSRGAIWVYFGLQVCFSEIPAHLAWAIWNRAVGDRTNRYQVTSSYLPLHGPERGHRNADNKVVTAIPAEEFWNMSYEVIKVDRQDRVAVVTLNRPEVLNALSYQLVRELDEAVTEMGEDDGVGAIVLTGMGERAFSAGADIHENRELEDEERDRITAERADFTWRLAASPKPVIGAINGLCYGGGTVMATSLDFLLGCERSSFRFLAVNYGQMNATWSLPTMVGWPRAKELLYSGREVFADEAYHIGLLNHLVPSEQLMDKAVEAAAGIAKNRAEGVANIKQILMEHTGNSLEEQFRDEVEARAGRFRGLSVEEGFKDFLDRKGRKPRV